MSYKHFVQIFVFGKHYSQVVLVEVFYIKSCLFVNFICNHVIKIFLIYTLVHFKSENTVSPIVFPTPPATPVLERFQL